MLRACGEYRRGLIDLARGARQEAFLRQRLRDHAADCPECARFYEKQEALHAALQSLVAEDIPAEVAAGARVFAEFDKVRVTRRPERMPMTRWIWAAGIAAMILLAALWSLRESPAKESVAAAAVQESPFLTIPYTIPLAPEERADVVRMRIPVTALLAAGFHVPMVDPGTNIDADVLVSADGRARAIRPISISISN